MRGYCLFVEKTRHDNRSVRGMALWLPPVSFSRRLIPLTCYSPRSPRLFSIQSHRIVERRVSFHVRLPFFSNVFSPVSSSFFFFTLLCPFLLYTRIQWSYTLHQSRLNISRTCNTNFPPPFPCFLLFPPSFFLRSLVPLTHITRDTELKPKILAEGFRFHCTVNFLGYRCYSRVCRKWYGRSILLFSALVFLLRRKPWFVRWVIFFQTTYLRSMRLLVVDFNCVCHWRHVL